MAGVITQLIKLAGSDEIKAQFKAMGDEGAKAFDKTRSAIAHLNKDMQVAGQSANTAGEAWFTSGQKAVLAIGGVVGLATAVVQLAQSFLESATAAAKFTSEQAAAATRAGQTTQNYREAIGSLKQLGLTAADAESVFKKFGANATEAIKKAREELRKRGMTFAPGAAGDKAAVEWGNLSAAGADAAKKMDPILELMKQSGASIDPMTGKLRMNQAAWEKLADHIQKIESPLERVKALMKAGLGEEEARSLAPKLALGGEAYRKEAKDFQRITGNQSEEQIKNNEKVAASYEKAMLRLETVNKEGSRQTGLHLAEIFTPFIDRWTEVRVQQNKELDEFYNRLKQGPIKGETTGFPEMQAPPQVPAEVSGEGLAPVTTLFDDAWEAIKSGAQTAWDAIASGAQTAWDAIASGAQTAWDAIASGAQTAWDAIASGAQTAWDAIASGAQTAWQAVSSAAQGAWQAIQAAAQSCWSFLTSGWSSVTEAALAAFDGLIAGVAEKFNAIVEVAKKVWESIKSIFSQPIRGPEGGPAPSVGEFASGGRVRGPGTGTSDSILARLSNGEFVMRAAAVKHYGPSLMSAINSMRFAGGGLVDLLPRFQRGGATAQQQQQQQQQQRILQIAMDAGLRAAEATNKEMQEHQKKMSEILNNLMQAFTGGIGGVKIGFGPGPVNQLAGGGAVRGPGTSTSDSILARLSHGEFVIRAAAVKKYGVNRLAALNAMRMPGFNMGGLVDGLNRSLSSLMVPGLASGGVAEMATSAGGRPLVLNFPSGAQFNGSVVDVMGTFEREALSLQNSSTGTLPSWVGK